MITPIRAHSFVFQPIRNAAKRLAELILDSIRFPTRYFGAKIRSCYPKKSLSSQETLLFMKHISVARAVKSGNELWIRPLGMHLTDHHFIDIRTGLQIAVAESEDEVIVGFGARGWDGGSLTSEKDMSTYKNTQLGVIFGNPLGYKPACYEQADRLFQQIKNDPKFAGKKISLTGNCYGGALASYVALQNQVEAVCFNCFTLGAGLQQAIGEKKLKMADKLILQLSTENDLVSDNRILQLFDKALGFLGIKTPGRFGRRYTVPRHYAGIWQNHIHVYATMMHHMGHPTNTKTSDLSKKELDLLRNYIVSFCKNLLA